MIFDLSANLKLKKIKFVKTVTSLGSYWRKYKNRGSWELLLLASDCSTQWVFRKKLNFEGLQIYNRHESHLMIQKNLLVIVLDILLQWLAFLWTSNDWIMWSVAHNLAKFLVYKPPQFERFTEFRFFFFSCRGKICTMALWHEILSFQ